MHLISKEEEIEREMLTIVLKEAGYLKNNEVTEVLVKPYEGPLFASAIYFLTLCYRNSTSLPKNMILKLKRERTEVDFYNFVRNNKQLEHFLISSYSAVWDENIDQSHLLMDDLSRTHFIFDDYSPISDDYIGLIIDILADLHAFFWEYPESSSNNSLFKKGWWWRDSSFLINVKERSKEYSDFVNTESETLSVTDIELYSKFIDALPALWKNYFKPRFKSNKNLTLTHGDCFHWQFFLPEEQDSSKVMMMDFDFAVVNSPAIDICLLIATHCSSEYRSQGGRELKLITRYLDRLRSKGVINYSKDEFMKDYVILIGCNILWTFKDRFRGCGREWWEPKLKCLTSAFKDLAGEKIIDELLN